MTSTDSRAQATAADFSSASATQSWLAFDIHDRVGMRVDPDAPTASLLSDLFGCFLTDDRTVAGDLVVSEKFEPMVDESFLEDEYAYTDTSLEMRAAKVQVVGDGDHFRLHGSGELLTSALPLLDQLLVRRGTAMIHAATVSFRGHGIALPAGGGTGKTSTIAKLMKQPEFAFMGDDWAFLTDTGELLGFAKPLFIKPHHRPIFPHLFEGARKPLVPVRLSRPVGRLTTIVHPVIRRYPRVAAFSRRWSPEHRRVLPSLALPHSEIATNAPLALSVYLERFAGNETRLLERDREWMVSRMMGNFHVEMPQHSQEMVTAMGATGLVSLPATYKDKEAVLAAALSDKPSYVLQVPEAMPPDDASDDIVGFLYDVLASNGLLERQAPLQDSHEQ